MNNVLDFKTNMETKIDKKHRKTSSCKIIYMRYLNEYKCKYYLLKGMKRFKDKPSNITSYGIRIDIVSPFNIVKNSIVVEDVGINLIDVKKYLTKLYDEKITPENIQEKNNI